jgi:hypothetical protein
MIKMMILAVFRSRSQSLDYAERLKSYGVMAETVPTPKEAKIGCGLCVRFDERVFARAKAVLVTAKYSTFKGFYKMDFRNGQVIVLPLPYTGRR